MSTKNIKKADFMEKPGLRVTYIEVDDEIRLERKLFNDRETNFAEERELAIWSLKCRIKH